MHPTDSSLAPLQERPQERLLERNGARPVVHSGEHSGERPDARKHRILLAEDEQNVRRVIAAHLRRSGFEVVEAHNSPTAQDLFRREAIDLVLTDLKMPDSEQDGFDVLRCVVSHTPKNTPRIPVLILTAHGTADKALEALSQGAYNLISKPCDMRELLTQVKNAIQEREDALSALQIEEPVGGRYGIIGKTPALLRIFDTIATVADSPSTVLITGESGTGKELVARALHVQSSRSDKPFIKLNCAAIPENLVESELFGHEKGAFTGAVATRAGKFEQAHTGTLFLDEIGELKLELQVKLLRCLQEQEFERVGGVRTLKVDVRVLAATNRDLEADVKAGLFREDLYYRLNVVPVRLPPLRERNDDIPLLVEHFLTKYNKRLSKNMTGVDRTLLELLGRYAWPGNIRELENVVERMVLFADSNMLGIRHVPPELLARLREGDTHRADAAKTVASGGQAPAGASPAPAPVPLTLGAAAPAAAAPMANTSGTPIPGASILGTPIPGTSILGTSIAGTPIPGTPIPGTSIPGASSPGANAQGTAPAPAGGAGSLKDLVRERTAALERDLILQALEASGWNVTRTAERLGLSRKGLQVKMKELDIRKPGS